MSVEREVFEQIDFDNIISVLLISLQQLIINQCAAVKEKRIGLLGLKLSAEPKALYPINQKTPLVS